MAVVPPSIEELRAIADRYGFRFDDADLKSFSGLVQGNLAAHEAVERLWSAPLPPERRYEWPQENPLGAWYVRTSIAPTGEGPLSGREVVIKDNIAVAGVPMANGSRAVEGFVPSRDAAVVSRVLAAGGTVVGKSVCEDLCYSGSSFTSCCGPVLNPWDRTRHAGGSSSGNAALLAAGETQLAIGGDQGGSVRMPAAFCGIVGHKPTHGLVPYTGAFPIETTIDHLGPMTRTVRDAALLLSVLAGDDGYDSRQYRTPEPQDYLSATEQDIRGLRVGVLTEGFGLPMSEPGVDDAVRAAIDQLAAAGAVVAEVSVPWHRDGLDVWTVIGTDGTARQMIDGHGYGMNVAGRYDPELMVHFARGMREHANEMSDTLKTMILTGAFAAQRYDMRHYAMARELAWDLRAAYDAALAEHDVLVLPTVPYVARPLPGPDATREQRMDNALSMVGNTAPFDASGHPAISVPAGLVNGLPTGLMIVGRRFDDATCLRAAAAYERQVGGFPSPA
ncbi:amidase [Amycolatopsis sp. K13G38]|uniref:Amidase n=1 Tax=Amycolatopsis acididurans TaxID=2724524 RepID=A0ABX1J041_9PSEU|nr:amidase [Amycolatopsis acididurans]NKQ53121.1 amidase [Amycolatopsis acididurans]